MIKIFDIYMKYWFEIQINYLIYSYLKYYMKACLHIYICTYIYRVYDIKVFFIVTFLIIL